MNGDDWITEDSPVESSPVVATALEAEAATAQFADNSAVPWIRGIHLCGIHQIHTGCARAPPGKGRARKCLPGCFLP